MYYLTYDPDKTGSTNITKISTTRQKAVEPFVEVSADLYKRFHNNPNNYVVKDGRLQAIERSLSNLTKVKGQNVHRKQIANEIGSQLEVGGYTYNINSAFQNNLTLILGIQAGDSDYVARLWCHNGTDWVFRDHSHEDTLQVAKAFNERREQLSQQLYEKL
jgi:hypothetical protein